MLARLYRGTTANVSSLFASPIADSVRAFRCTSVTAAASSSNPSANQRKLMATKDLVESTISGNKIAIFSKSYCPYCKRAKALLTSKFPDVPTKIYELDEIEEGSAIQQYLLEKTGQRTVPNVFISQQHVGGCDDVVSLDSQGKLAGLVGA
ncbi:hypothetical protein AcV5_005047 [Taiwanofungus camphoratus]|nr:hypothetical protein AcV5_005047 [Antrodia cinnamomea]